MRIKIEISWDNEKNESKGDENRTEQNKVQENSWNRDEKNKKNQILYEKENIK